MNQAFHARNPSNIPLVKECTWKQGKNIGKLFSDTFGKLHHSHTGRVEKKQKTKSMANKKPYVNRIYLQIS